MPNLTRAEIRSPINRRDSMILVFRMGPAANGRGLCDIDRVFFKVAQLRAKNVEHEKNIPIT